MVPKLVDTYVHSAILSQALGQCFQRVSELLDRVLIQALALLAELLDLAGQLDFDRSSASQQLKICL